VTWAAYEVHFRNGALSTVVAQSIDAAIFKAVQVVNEPFPPGIGKVDEITREHITRVDELARPVHVAEEVKKDGGD
jgi:hypothetical protein